jgi:hypothetical protein
MVPSTVALGPTRRLPESAGVSLLDPFVFGPAGPRVAVVGQHLEHDLAFVFGTLAVPVVRDERYRSLPS